MLRESGYVSGLILYLYFITWILSPYIHFLPPQLCEIYKNFSVIFFFFLVHYIIPLLKKNPGSQSPALHLESAGAWNKKGCRMLTHKFPPHKYLPQELFDRTL